MTLKPDPECGQEELGGLLSWLLLLLVAIAAGVVMVVLQVIEKVKGK